MVWSPCLIRYWDRAGAVSVVLGHPLLDDYLEFVAARSRTNTLLATAYDLKVFFSVVAKPPTEVSTADVLAFITAQRTPRGGEGKVVRLADGEKGLSARTIKRRLSSVSGLFSYLVTRADVGLAANPVPRGLTTRHAIEARPRGAPLIRTPRTLPRILNPAEVDALFAVLRAQRDRAMVEAMVLGGLRRCEVLGLRPGGPQDRRTARVRRRGQGRPPAADPRLGAVLHNHRRLPATRAPRRLRHRPAVRRAQGTQPRLAAVAGGAG